MERVFQYLKMTVKIPSLTEKKKKKKIILKKV